MPYRRVLWNLPAMLSALLVVLPARLLARWALLLSGLLWRLGIRSFIRCSADRRLHHLCLGHVHDVQLSMLLDKLAHLRIHAVLVRVPSLAADVNVGSVIIHDERWHD